MHINVSAGKLNYSQRNNERDPLLTCNVTSMVMSLDYLGYDFPKGKYAQPEDNLHHYMTEKMLRPWIHADLSQATNEWMGKKVTTFSTNRSVVSILDELRNDRPVVMSGDFPGVPTKRATPLGHIVVLVGAIWPEKDFEKNPASVIIDDPYGNTLNDWKGSGNDIVLTWGMFVNWFKPVGADTVKWGHFFRRNDE